jgi:hypothetical protein
VAIQYSTAMRKYQHYLLEMILGISPLCLNPTPLVLGSILNSGTNSNFKWRRSLTRIIRIVLVVSLSQTKFLAPIENGGNASLFDVGTTSLSKELSPSAVLFTWHG